MTKSVNYLLTPPLQVDSSVLMFQLRLLHTTLPQIEFALFIMQELEDQLSPPSDDGRNIKIISKVESFQGVQHSSLYPSQTE